MITIEKAKTDHITHIESLYAQLFEFVAKLQPYHFQPAQQDRLFLEHSISDNNSILLVAKDAERIVGFILAKEQQTPPYNCFIQRRLVYIYDIIVDSSYRGKGIGKLLLNEVEKWTTDKGIEYVELSVLNENIRATELYEELGYSKTILTMGKVLK